MNKDYAEIPVQAVKLAEEIKAILHGEESHRAIEAMIVVVSDLMALCAYDLESAEAATYGFSASVIESIRAMDRLRICCWSEKLN